MAGLMLLGLGIMFARIVQLQLAPSARLAEHMQSRVTRAPLPGIRGELMDRRGRLLSTTRIGYRVFADPTMLPEDLDGTILRLSEAMGVAPEVVGEPLMAKVALNDARALLRPAATDREQPSVAQMFRRFVGAEGSGGGDAGHGGMAMLDEPAPDEEQESGVPSLVRYVPLGPVLSEERIAAVRALKLPGVYLERRHLREYPAGAVVASVVGKVGDEPIWNIGAERILDTKLEGTGGRARYVRDAKGRPLWVEPGQWEPARRGTDVRLSIDLELQRIAYEELTRGIEEANAAGGRCIMLDPLTGEVLAMVDIVRDLPELVPFKWEPKDPNAAGKGATPPAAPRARYQTLTDDPGRRIHPALARNRVVEDVYEPGSTFKSFVWAVITERGLAKPDEVFDTEGGRWYTFYRRYVEDVTKRDIMTWREVLVNSSNIGMVKAAERMSFAELREAVTRFGFGKRTNLGLPGEGAGIVTTAKNWSKYTQTSVAIGHEVAVTPIQMVRAFSTFARPGELAGTMPDVTLVAVDAEATLPPILHRVLPASVATMTRETLAGVTQNVENRMKLQARQAARAGLEGESGAKQDWRYILFGKSGTAEIPLGKAPEGMRRPRGSSGYFDGQYNSSFIAGGPIEDPRLVCLVVIDDPGPERVRTRTHYGSMTAGPVVRRAMERSLTYMGVAPSVTPEAASLAQGGQ
jgi:cell division protein FtsI/penicillin-binding protein 2